MQQNYFTSSREILIQKEGLARVPQLRPLGRILPTTPRTTPDTTPIWQTQDHQIFQKCRWHTDYMWYQPLRCSEHIEGLQYNETKTQVYKRMWGNLPDKLHGYYYQLNPHWLENCRVQKTNIHWHNHSVQLQTPHKDKYATILFLYNRLNTYNLQEYDYDKEITTKQNILQNNTFPIHNHSTPQSMPISRRIQRTDGSHAHALPNT